MTPATVAGIQNCLALEHEAVWVYGFLGARVPAVKEKARDSFDAHRVSRDRLIALLDAASLSQPAPLTGYSVQDVKTPAQAARVARALEDKGAAAWLTVIGTSEGKDRRFALGMLRRAALAGIAWGGRPTAFPGLPV